MRILLAAVGRLKEGPERALFTGYAGRLEAAGRGASLGPLQLVELTEARAATAQARKADEAVRLAAAVAAAETRVCLDEGGRSMTSRAFADWLVKRRDSGCRTMAFLIGGPDGHGDRLLAAADLKLSLGPMTLPHGLARIVFAEQLYRAATIINGHPYHRD